MPEHDENDLGAELSRMEDDLLAIHDALVDVDYDGAINPESIIERIRQMVPRKGFPWPGGGNAPPAARQHPARTCFARAASWTGIIVGMYLTRPR